MDPALFERYAQAGRNRADVTARLEDDDIVQAALENTGKRNACAFTAMESAKKAEWHG